MFRLWFTVLQLLSVYPEEEPEDEPEEDPKDEPEEDPEDEPDPELALTC